MVELSSIILNAGGLLTTQMTSVSVGAPYSGMEGPCWWVVLLAFVCLLGVVDNDMMSH